MISDKKTILLLAAALFATAYGISSSVKEICTVLPRNSFILQPGSCTNWIKCPSSNKVQDYEEGSCLPGLFYDKDANKCRPEKEVRCPYEFSKNSSGICLYENDGTFLADPSSCYNFIYCNQSRAYTHPCPGRLVFNPDKSQCVYSDQYNCVEKKIAQTHDACLSISDSIQFADRESCVAYHKCDKGRLLNYTCSNGLAFDRSFGHCMKIENTECFIDEEYANAKNTICGTLKKRVIGFVSDNKTCSGYYHCLEVENGVDRNPIWNKCLGGGFFDAKTLSCRDRTAVPCAHDRCEGMDNKYVNIAGNCTKYAVCMNNVRSDIGQCSQGYYFDEKSQGCTKQKVQYAACS